MPTLPRLSVQLYSLRRIPRLEDQFRLVREAGLDFVETTADHHDNPARVRGLLDSHGLQAPSGHVGIDRLRQGLAATIAAARDLGTDTLILWGFPSAERPRTAQAWQTAGAELGDLAARLGEEGLGLAFHNHDWEAQRFADGRSGLDHLFAGARDAPLKWQADLAWLARGGADVTSVIDAHAGRLHSAHAKDLAEQGTATDEDGWADLGHGTLPWPAWWRRLAGLGVDLVVLEHDEPADPARFLTRSADVARMLSAA